MSDWLIRDPKALSLLFEEELYLVQSKAPLVAQPALVEAASAAVQFDYLGENNRFFLILVNEPGQSYLEETNLEVLLKILMAKGMELKDVAILNLSRFPETNFMQLKAFFSCSRLCLFGVSPQQLGLAELPSNEINVQDDVKVLASFSLMELQQTHHKKLAFWNVMKNF